MTFYLEDTLILLGRNLTLSLSLSSFLFIRHASEVLDLTDILN